MHLETLSHTSSIDGTKPLLFDVCFKPARKKLPLIVVLHGFGGKKEFCRADIERLAAKGMSARCAQLSGVVSTA